METGDKVLVPLLAKAACCFGLALAATGARGGLSVWLLALALIALIAVIILRPSGRTAADALSESGEQGAPRRLEQQR